MIENYRITQDGVIEQIDKGSFNYGLEYSSIYDTYGELSNYISYLRLGYILGSIGFIPKSLLDVGYGNGAFLKAALNIIPECYGMDINSEYKLPAKCNRINSIHERHFDVITFFDSLEHMSEIEFVKDLKCNFICISVPWCHNFSNDWFINWKHLRPNEHLWHFNNESLKTFMKRMGYNCIQIGNPEDVIRKGNSQEQNILSAVFQKIIQ